MSEYLPDKGEKLREFFQAQGFPTPTGYGWQSIRCIMPEHPDRMRSASVNFGTGKYKCFGCDQYGDVLDIAEALGVQYELDKKQPTKKEEVWI